MSAPRQPFEIAIRVRESDIDELGHVNNVVYLRWVQEAAAAHWRSVAPIADQEGTVWIVLRHEIDYKKPAFAGEEVLARTWVGKASRLSFERHTELLRAEGGILLARACTLWCPLDALTRRPKQLTAEVRELFSVGAKGTQE